MKFDAKTLSSIAAVAEFISAHGMDISIADDKSESVSTPVFAENKSDLSQSIHVADNKSAKNTNLSVADLKSENEQTTNADLKLDLTSENKSEKSIPAITNLTSAVVQLTNSVTDLTSAINQVTATFAEFNSVKRGISAFTENKSEKKQLSVAENNSAKKSMPMSDNKSVKKQIVTSGNNSVKTSITDSDFNSAKQTNVSVADNKSVKKIDLSLAENISATFKDLARRTQACINEDLQTCKNKKKAWVKSACQIYASNQAGFYTAKELYAAFAENKSAKTEAQAEKYFSGIGLKPIKTPLSNNCYYLPACAARILELNQNNGVHVLTGINASIVDGACSLAGLISAKKTVWINEVNSFESKTDGLKKKSPARKWLVKQGIIDNSLKKGINPKIDNKTAVNTLRHQFTNYDDGLALVKQINDVALSRKAFRAVVNKTFRNMYKHYAILEPEITTQWQAHLLRS